MVRPDGMGEVTSTEMETIRLYDLSWSEGSQDFTVQLSRDAALSLFRALDSADGFVGVRMGKSRWASFRTPPPAEDEAKHEPWVRP